MLTLSSTLSDVLAEFVSLDDAHATETPLVTVFQNRIDITWLDTGRVNLDVYARSVGNDGIKMKPTQVIDVPGGENPNNPPVEEPPIEPPP